MLAIWETKKGAVFPGDLQTPCCPGQSCSEAGSLGGRGAGLGVDAQQAVPKTPARCFLSTSGNRPRHHPLPAEGHCRPRDWTICPYLSAPWGLGLHAMPRAATRSTQAPCARPQISRLPLRLPSRGGVSPAPGQGILGTPLQGSLLGWGANLCRKPSP